MNTDMNYEKDYLIIYKTMDGKFSNWEWSPLEKHSREELDNLITKWNEEQKAVENGRQVELITDPLIKGICAYRERSKPLERLADCIKEFNEGTRGVEEKIYDAVSDLKDVAEILNIIRNP